MAVTAYDLAVDWLVTVLLNLASEGIAQLTLVAGRQVRGRRAQKQPATSPPDALRGAIERAIAEVVSGVGRAPAHSDILRSFLSSTDAQATVRQIFAARLSANGSSRPLDLDAIGSRFAKALETLFRRQDRREARVGSL